jgi:hypothetical protein
MAQQSPSRYMRSVIWLAKRLPLLGLLTLAVWGVIVWGLGFGGLDRVTSWWVDAWLAHKTLQVTIGVAGFGVWLVFAYVAPQLLSICLSVTVFRIIALLRPRRA